MSDEVDGWKVHVDREPEKEWPRAKAVGALILFLVFFSISIGAGVKIGRDLEREEHECPKNEILPTHEGSVEGEFVKKHECTD